MNPEEETEIFQLLVQSANTFRSVHSLYNEYTSNNKNKPIPDKRKFILSCELLNTGFKNIKKTYKNNVLYLTFSTDKTLNEQFEMDSNVNDDKDFEALDKCDVIEYMFNNPKFSTNLSFSEYVDGTDTILHLLVRRNKYDLLNNIVAVYDVDFDIKNKNGEIVLDVIDFSDPRSSRQIIRTILAYQLNKYKLANANMDTELKRQNTQLSEKNYQLTSQTIMLRDESSYYQMLMYSMILLYVATIAYVFF